MTATVAALAVAWAAVAASAGSSLLSRRTNRRPAAPVPAGPRPARPAVAVAPRHAPMTALGRAVRRLATAADPTAAAGRASPTAAAGRATPTAAAGSATPTAAAGSASPTAASDQRELDRRAGWATVAAAGLRVLAPVIALLPVLWVTVAPALAARRAQAAHERRLLDQLPDV
ncbi:MAG TPA: hypothetical protein VFP06_03560, partial [Acidimicrobiales bacterium]|nr:hypothetical protein [Acidimicrobiales bacterium]